METHQIIDQIDKFQAQLLVNNGRGVEINNPVVLSSTIVKIRILLIQLVDKVADAEKLYRHTKSARFDKFIVDGMKRSPAFDQLDLEKDLIDMKIDSERLRNYCKYVDSLVSAVQSLLKVHASGERSQY